MKDQDTRGSDVGPFEGDNDTSLIYRREYWFYNNTLYIKPLRPSVGNERPDPATKGE